jgi:hypothetical protein
MIVSSKFSSRNLQNYDCNRTVLSHERKQEISVLQACISLTWKDIYDTGLLQIVEQSIKCEHDLSPNRPIYLVGDSFGGCLSLAVAARNPQIDLVLLLVNPGK